MSLLDQSQQWFPTSVQVTVHQARNLRVKGKNGTNDAYAIIQVAKDKFSTSVAEKCVAPVWKEEASFDLPLFHPGNSERCTLYIIVMHRAQVGLDKFLGQAVVNLLDLHNNKSRKKTDWFKLVDKAGKEDKVRGEVLLDIQFMRNNMSASMFDLSMQDKPRSRISKLKDKVRGKKKDGFSDSASAIVPPVSQVLTDSEGEPDSQSLNQSPGAKKKSKLKTLFAPKSNLQRNISQSMSTLGTLPEKNSSVSSSRSSGLNVDSPEGKKKFKFLGHKRTGSSDSKVSLGGFSLLGRNKQSNSDLNNLCINGSHVYAEEPESKSGSTLSLNSSGRGSAEDVRKHTSDATDRAVMEQQRLQQEEKQRQAEESRLAEARRLEEEEKYKAEAKRLQEEEQRRRQEDQDRRRRVIEDETRRKKHEEEEERRKKTEELKMLEAAENQRLEEERRKAEEQKRQEEASMTDRLTSLFGMIRKKEEKKEEHNPSAQSSSKSSDQSHLSTNPFEEIPLNSDSPPATNKLPTDEQKSGRNAQTPSAMVFLNRTAKVSAVKPRLAQILECEVADYQTFPSQPDAAPVSPVSPQSPDIFSSLHSSLAPPNRRARLSSFPPGNAENLSPALSEETSRTMADQRRRSPSAPIYATVQKPNKGNGVPVREISNPAYVEQPALPLPDYETLFPQKRHGVKAQSKWDHIIAEVNQRHRDFTPELLGPEMCVDGPERPQPSPRSSISLESPGVVPVQNHSATRPASSQKAASPTPPKYTETTVNQPVVEPRSFKSLHSPRSSISTESLSESNFSETRPGSSQKAASPTPPKYMDTTVNQPVADPRSFKSSHSPRSSISTENLGVSNFPETKPLSSKKVAAPTPPRRESTPDIQPVVESRSSKAVERPKSSILTESPKLSTLVERPKSSILIESPATKNYSEARPPSSKKVAAPGPPKSVATPINQTAVDSSNRKSELMAPQTTSKPNSATVPTPGRADTSAVRTSTGDKKALLPPKIPTPVRRPISQINLEPTSSDDEKRVQGGVRNDLPTAKPRQTILATESKQEKEEAAWHDDQWTNSSSDEKIKMESFADFDLIPSTNHVTTDSKTQPKQSQKINDVLTVGKRLKPEDLGMTANDLDKIFNQPDPFDNVNRDFADQQNDPWEDKEESKQASPTFQRKNSQKGKLNPPSTRHSDKKIPSQQEASNQERTTTSKVDEGLANPSVTLQPQADPKTQNGFHPDVDPFGAEPFQAFSLPVVMEEPASQAGSLSVAKTPLKAWVSPSEFQPTQSSNESELAFTPRRPHPVKPLSTNENQHHVSSPAVKELNVRDSTPGKIKGVDESASGPYSQLTQEELITLVVKQQTDLSKKDAKITELEEYIDKLLVRVIEEQPAILQALNFTKQV